MKNETGFIKISPCLHLISCWAKHLIKTAFNWFLGDNRLHQIIYNPCTGGCYDGLEETNVNLNQGAESTVCYLIARLTMGRYKNDKRMCNHHRHVSEPYCENSF